MEKLTLKRKTQRELKALLKERYPLFRADPIVPFMPKAGKVLEKVFQAESKKEKDLIRNTLCRVWYQRKDYQIASLQGEYRFDLNLKPIAKITDNERREVAIAYWYQHERKPNQWPLIDEIKPFKEAFEQAKKKNSKGQRKIEGQPQKKQALAATKAVAKQEQDSTKEPAITKQNKPKKVPIVVKKRRRVVIPG